MLYVILTHRSEKAKCFFVLWTTTPARYTCVPAKKGRYDEHIGLLIKLSDYGDVILKRIG